MQLTDQIKSRVDIVDVVSQYVTLKKAGKNYKGLCPFHDERSPSFFVSPDKEIAYCFSCQGGGDVFKFIMQIEDCSFGEALQILAEKADIDLQSSDEYKSFSADRKEKINKEDKDEYLR
ncbi:MAG: CHC2 zinc finger domain-containing protein [Patescibacteria group bacterium]|nr:CHC2 zinc finger domain-containing protein [Patescibacteria group bacterium]